MVTVSDVGWGSYLTSEGPYFRGSRRFVLPSSPTFREKSVAVVTATEGGSLDAINMYDRCRLSVGAIQFCEATFNVSKLLTACADSGLSDLVGSRLGLLPIPLRLVKDQYGRPRMAASNGFPIDSGDAMRAMLLGGSSGLRGGWTDDQKTFAKKVASVFANLLAEPAMMTAQAAHTGDTVSSYLLPRAQGILSADPSEDGWSGAMRAMIVSFAVNLPAVADRLLASANSGPHWTRDPQDRFYAAAQSLTTNSGIGIWPGRYTKIVPILRSAFGVPVPELAELAVWKFRSHNPELDDPLDTTEEIQRFLLARGADLGPAGADGVYGEKTRAAVRAFQAGYTKEHLDVDGVVGKDTKAAMKAVLETE